MAIRMYQDPSGPPQMQPQQMHDPFAMMDEMMMAGPFGGMGGRRGGMGGIFGMMDAMMGQMMGPAMGGPGMRMGGLGMMEEPGGMMLAGPGGMMMGGGGGQMMAMGMNGGEGGFSCQTMMVSSQMGADGQVHTERFASSSVGDPTRRIQEVQQAYSNSSTGVDKMSLERQLQDRGRKVVKERDATTGDERSTELYRGMEEAQNEEFDQQWTQDAAPYLPRHAGDVRAIMAPPSGGYPLPIQQGPLAIQQGRAMPTIQSGEGLRAAARVAAPPPPQPATVIHPAYAASPVQGVSAGYAASPVQGVSAGTVYTNTPVSIQPGTAAVGSVQYARPPSSTQYASTPAVYQVRR